MTPVRAIASLDRQIAKHGQPVTLRRGSPSTKLDTRAFVRGYKPDEIAGLIQQGDSLVVLSPSGLSGIFLSTPPKHLDRVDINGDTKTVTLADPVFLGSTLVRVNLTVRGEQ